MKRRRPQQQKKTWKVNPTFAILIISYILPLLQSESLSTPIVLQPLEKRNIISGVVTPSNIVEASNRKRLPPRQVIYEDYINNGATTSQTDNVYDNDNNKDLPIILRPLTSKIKPKLNNKIHSLLQTDQEEDLPVFYYNATDRVENTLPEIIFDKEGNRISIKEIIKGNNDILLETDKAPSPPHNPHESNHILDKRILPLPTLIPLTDLKNKTDGQETNFIPKIMNNPTSSPTSKSFITKNSSTTKTASTTASSTATNNSTKTRKHKIKINPSDWEHLAPEAQDQMIIISTVATMALLVGALSARRLRSRQFLSSCIENESLEDELAYDTAYTTEDRNAFGKGYDTFSSVPWRGDLEKFDV